MAPSRHFDGIVERTKYGLSYNKTKEMQLISQIYFFGIELYVFRTRSLSIIRGLALCTQQ